MDVYEFEPPDTDAVCELCGTPFNCLGVCPNQREHTRDYWDDMQEGDPNAEDIIG